MQQHPMKSKQCECPPADTGRRERARRRLWDRNARSWTRAALWLAALAVAALTLSVVSSVRGELQESEEVPAKRVELGVGIAGVDEELTPLVVDDPVEVPTPPPATRLLDGGEASFYHSSLEGRATASGEPYRGSQLTAAHRTLPFGSRVRVTHLATGRSVVVRINDRGPFARRRVIDLSRAAAEKLGIVRQGRGKVRLELLIE